MTFRGGHKYTPPGQILKIWPDFRNLTPRYIWGVHRCISHSSACQTARHPLETLLVTLHTPVDTCQSTTPGTPTSPSSRRSPRSNKTKACTSITIILPVAPTANRMLSDELQRHIRLDALLETRRRHVPLKTAHQTLTNELRHQLVCLNALPQATKRHVATVCVVFVVGSTTSRHFINHETREVFRVV